MTDRALFNQYVKFQINDFTGSQPMDVSRWRSLASNAEHLWNSSGQVLVNHIQTSGSNFTGDNSTPKNTALYLFSFGPFPIQIHPYDSRRTVPVYIEINAKTNDGTNPVNFLIGLRNVLDPVGSNLDATSTGIENNIKTLATTSNAWTAINSELYLRNVNTINLSSRLIETDLIPTINYAIVEAFIDVYIVIPSSNVSATPGGTIYGVYAIEHTTGGSV